MLDLTMRVVFKEFYSHWAAKIWIGQWSTYAPNGSCKVPNCRDTLRLINAITSPNFPRVCTIADFCSPLAITSSGAGNGLAFFVTCSCCLSQCRFALSAPHPPPPPPVGMKGANRQGKKHAPPPPPYFCCCFSQPSRKCEGTRTSLFSNQSYHALALSGTGFNKAYAPFSLTAYPLVHLSTNRRSL